MPYGTVGRELSGDVDIQFIHGAVPAPGGRFIARARDGRVDPFNRREHGPRADPAVSPATSQEMATVFVVDDDVSVRESLDLLISFAGWRPETFTSAQEFLARPRAFTPSCLVLDISLPGLNGLDLQKLVADRTDMPVIFITGYGDIPMTVRAMKAGAFEFLTKPFDDEVLLGAIRQAVERSRAALGREAEIQALRDCYASLTPREREVMALVASGLLNKQVGLRLGISEITVKAHRGKVMQKMGADSLADLVKIAERLRLAPAEVLPS
jgi:FixJ family two-component response regulator